MEASCNECLSVIFHFSFVCHWATMTDQQQPNEHPVEHHHQVVDPWTVEAGPGGIDYDKLIAQFGCERVSNELIERIERLTKKPAHPWLKRGYFFSHRYYYI